MPRTSSTFGNNKAKWSIDQANEVFIVQNWDEALSVNINGASEVNLYFSYPSIRPSATSYENECVNSV